MLRDPAFLIWVRSSFLLALTDLSHCSLEPHPRSLDSALRRLPACAKAFPLRAQSSISHCGVSHSPPPPTAPPPTGSADSPALGCFASGSLGLHVGTHCLVIVLCGRSTLQRWCFPFTRSSYSVTLTPLPSSGVASAQTFVPASTSRGWRKMLRDFHG